MAEHHCPTCGQDVEYVCLWCGKPAVAFCDAWIGSERKDGLITMEAPHFTCDAPLCAEHRHPYGFVCGKELDMMDHCPYHQQHETTLDNTAHTQADAEKVRRAVWATGRHAHIRRASKIDA